MPDKSDIDFRSFRRCGGTRIATVLIYLCDVSRGGETRFTQLDRADAPSGADERLSIQPQRGTAVVFFPATLPCQRTWPGGARAARA